MKPYVTVHMISSIDGKIDARRWAGNPGAYAQFAGEYEAVHEMLGATSWIVGRTTMQEFACRPSVDIHDDGPLPRATHNAAPDADSFAVVIDPKGKLTWDRDNVNGDRVIEVLTEQVSDRYLHHLKSMGVSYVFGGTDTIDIRHVLHELKATFKIDSLLVEGGGILNGSFIAAGVIDEISLLVAPIADGQNDGPMTFDHRGPTIPATELELMDVQKRDHGVLWLRYRVARKI